MRTFCNLLGFQNRIVPSGFCESWTGLRNVLRMDGQEAVRRGGGGGGVTFVPSPDTLKLLS